MMITQDLIDWLFRFGLYRGVKIDPPTKLIDCQLDYDGQFGRRYLTSINHRHALAAWLLNECEGPWAIRMKHPLDRKETYLSFARAADAVMLKFLLS